MENFELWCEATGQDGAKEQFKTSLEDYQKMGIKMTPQQWQKIEMINSCMRIDKEYCKTVPVHFVLMVLKALELI